MQIITRSVIETELLGARLAQAAELGDCFCLNGDLGAGKTAFARGFVQSLAGKVDVISPTFNLLQTYTGHLGSGESISLWHYDLYRVQHAHEMDELALEEAFQGAITLIEWPEIARRYIPASCVEVNFSANTALENERAIVLKVPPHWHTKLKNIGI